jgi:hypothetical protein
MEGLVVLGVIVGALGLLDFVALRFGVDSRIESSDPRSPARGLTV